MTWVALGLFAGLVLGTYDFLTKLALREKSVLDVVVLSSALGAFLWLPFLLAPATAAPALQPWGLYPAPLGWREQALVLPKSLMMVATWVLSYYAVKALPLSISAGVRASGPLWTAAGAIVLLGEQLTGWQWLGLAVSMLSYHLFARIGSREGIRFHRDGWVLCMLAATLLSSANALYDKHILAGLRLDLAAVQAWSALQRGVIALALLPWVWRSVSLRGLFTRHWAVPAIALAYLAAEYLYLAAVQTEGAMISVISVLRRTNLVMVFGLSALFFQERFIRQKTLAIAGVLAGIVLTLWN
ncbi:EamA family transporter [Acidovorax sp.]|uniref:EamA family transporter n=1 Tax=unclassified Acidovorax TaxID=2684926 RepID=UPI003D025EFB